MLPASLLVRSGESRGKPLEASSCLQNARGWEGTKEMPMLVINTGNGEGSLELSFMVHVFMHGQDVVYDEDVYSGRVTP